jgi:hypothetical protein
MTIQWNKWGTIKEENNISFNFYDLENYTYWISFRFAIHVPPWHHMYSQKLKQTEEQHNCVSFCYVTSLQWLQNMQIYSVY